jgi:hypothetical protein
MPRGDRPDQGLDFRRGEGAQHRRFHAPVVGAVLHAENEVRSARQFGHLRPVWRLEFIPALQYVANVGVPGHEQEIADGEIGPEPAQQRQRPARIIEEKASYARREALGAEASQVEWRHFRQRTLAFLSCPDGIEILYPDHARSGPPALHVIAMPATQRLGLQPSRVCECFHSCRCSATSITHRSLRVIWPVRNWR